MTGLLTFHWADDCGGMLQAYALKRYLELQGEEAVFLPYAPRKLTGRYWWAPLIATQQQGRIRYQVPLLWWGGNALRGTGFWRRRRLMRRFRRQYLTTRPPVRRAEQLSLAGLRCLFVGSDQVWNPAITVGLDDAYLGELPGKETCRIASYAASMGGDRLPEDCRARFARQVGENFAAVSVREESAVPFVAELLGREPACVLDPTLLLDREEWERVAVPPKEERYLLVYATQRNTEMAEEIRAFAREQGLRAIQLSAQRWWEITAGVESRDAVGPAEFVGYFRNAACVITNSFHGTVFSILFRRPFLTFCHTTRGARMGDLLNKLGLLERLATGEIESDRRRLAAPTDWEGAAERLTAARQQSEAFIARQLQLAEQGETR